MARVSDRAWHTEPFDSVVRALHTDLARGLDPDEAARRLARDGPNEIERPSPVAPLAILARQFAGIVIWVLVGAAIVSAALGERLDAAAILAIVALNAVIGFFQEYRAERAVEALARLSSPRVRVVRGGVAEVVPAREVANGDVLFLESGDVIAADARLGVASELSTNEAPLTGESESVRKRAAIHAPDTPLADRTNMVFSGTSVAAGSARAVVVATGMRTELGKIATLLETASAGETPLQRRLDRVGKRLLTACVGIVVFVVGLGILRSIEPFELFLTAVSLAVAAIPEGLPAVVTVALALGVSRMVRRNALVRRLSAVETLGCAQVICTDKTGTLTVGEMTARKIVTAQSIFHVTGEGYSTDGAVVEGGETASPEHRVLLDAALRVAAGCNDAELGERAGRPVVVGDPTEGALLVLAEKAGVRRSRIESEMPRLAEIPFDSERKRMTVIRARGEEVWALVKGAPERVLERCTHVRTIRGVEPLDPTVRCELGEANRLLADDALRVLALAERRLPAFPVDGDVETNLVFLGLVGLQDPPRPEAVDAVRRARGAGIRTVMITGDHPGTARAIARELGILRAGDGVIVGPDLDRMNDEELGEHVEGTVVYARVTAEHKLRIVRAWKGRGAVVAMTGDGVNDAPALKEASIGIAMGIAGTEVTKQTADMVITDDDFASIVAAVEEGRGIYDNISKTLGYLLAGNAGELLVMFVAVLFGWPLPLLPIQILWINLVTDGLPALALATDPVDPDALRRPPRRTDAEIVDRGFLARLLFVGSLTAATALSVFAWELHVDGDLVAARNAAFSVLVFAELLRSFGARSETRTFWEIGLFSNMRLFAIATATFTLQIFAHDIPVLERLFATRPVSASECLVWMALGMLPLLVLETSKLLARRRRYEGGPSTSATTSTWSVWGNMSNGRSRTAR